MTATSVPTALPVVRASADTPQALQDITADVNLTTYSGSTGGVTVVVHNTRPPSRAAQSLPVTLTARDTTGKTVSVTTQTLAIPGLDSHFSGTVTLDVPLTITVTNLESDSTSTIDDQGTHVVRIVNGLDGGGTLTTSFSVAWPLFARLQAIPAATVTPAAAN